MSAEMDATAVTEGHLAEVADAEAEQDALTAERDELRAGAQVDAWLGESVARLLTAETARGRFERDGDMITLTDAQVVRVWGTTRGLGEIAAGGPTAATKLDPAGTVTCHVLTTVAMLDCDPGRWSL